MAVNPLSPSVIELHRERILTDIGRIRDSKNLTPDPDQLEKLFNRAAFLSNKANIVARSLSEVAEKYFIPVDPEATDVVAAVKRKSADSLDGLKISFDLFKDAVKASQQTKKDMEETVILSQSITTGSVLQKRIRKIRARASIMVQSGFDPEDQLLETLVSQFIILWIAHELMKPFEAITDHTQLSETWVEKGSGSSKAQIIISILIGLVMQFIIMGLNDDLMEEYLNEAAGGIFPEGHTAASIIAEARSFEKTRAHELAEIMVGLNDYEIILRYSFQYLRATTEPGYDFWLAYVDAVQMRYTAQSLWVQAPHYSVSHAIVTQTFQAGHKRPRNWDKLGKQNSTIAFDDVGRIDSELVRNEFRQTIVSSLVPMAQVSYLARSDTLDGIDQNLDLIAQVFSSDFAIEIAYCIGSFLGKLDPKILRALRAMLDGLLKAHRFDFGAALNAMLDALITPNFEEVIAQEAMHQIDKIFDKLIDKVLGLFGDDIEPLLCCPFIGEIIQMVLESIIRLEAELKGAVKIFLGKLLESTGIGSVNIALRAEQKYEERIIHKMIKIIDSVIRAVEAMDAATEDKRNFSPKPQDLHTSIQLPVLQIDDNERTNYFTSALPRELSNGKFLPALGEKIEATAVGTTTDALDRIAGKHSCSSAFSQEILNKAARSFVTK
jgi:hypothetical protein